MYCREYLCQDEASAVLLDSLDGKTRGEPSTARVSTGMRRFAWAKNCVALGLASGCLEPLDSTAIHVVQSAMTRPLRYLPEWDFEPRLPEEFDHQSPLEFKRVSDFVILHCKIGQWRDSEL